MGAEPEMRHLLLLFHANGMSKGAYRPWVHGLADLLGAVAVSVQFLRRNDVECYQLGQNHFVVLVDMLGHGDAEAMDKSAVWTCQASHVGQVTSQAIDIVKPVTTSIVGHSLGGGSAVVSLLEDHLAPVDQVVLFEPMYIFKPNPKLNTSPLVQQTLRRRAVWPDADCARKYLLSKQLYSSWDSRALEGYLDDAFIQRVHDIELKCAPATEAAIFSSGISSELYDKLQSTTLSSLSLCKCVHVLFGNAANALWDAERVDLVFKALPNLTAAQVCGGHLFPLEEPRHFAQEVLLRIGWSRATQWKGCL